MGAFANVYSGFRESLSPRIRRRWRDAWGCEIAEGKVGLTVTKFINTLADAPGKVKCVYIMGENPMISDPDLHHVEKAMKNTEFMVVQDIFMTETAQFANVVLPAACYAEKDGTQTNTERRVQKWRKAQDPPCEGRPTGKSSASWQNTWDSRNSSRTRVQRGIHRNLQGYPVLWWHDLCTARETRSPALAVPDSRAPGNTHPAQGEVHHGRTGYLHPYRVQIPGRSSDKDYPLILTTGRCIWQWHTGTMTRRSESLEREEPPAG